MESFWLRKAILVCKKHFTEKEPEILARKEDLQKRIHSLLVERTDRASIVKDAVEYCQNLLSEGPMDLESLKIHIQNRMLRKVHETIARSGSAFPDVEVGVKYFQDSNMGPSELSVRVPELDSFVPDLGVFSPDVHDSGPDLNAPRLDPDVPVFDLAPDLGEDSVLGKREIVVMGKVQLLQFWGLMANVKGWGSKVPSMSIMEELHPLVSPSFFVFDGGGVFC